jgi:MOSC domain-containing protein YiiM
MSMVLRDGEVRAGDSITVLLPEPPHRQLVPV